MNSSYVINFTAKVLIIYLIHDIFKQNYCGPWRSWTINLQIMSLLLWPIELKALYTYTIINFLTFWLFWIDIGDSRRTRTVNCFNLRIYVTILKTLQVMEKTGSSVQFCPYVFALSLVNTICISNSFPYFQLRYLLSLFYIGYYISSI